MFGCMSDVCQFVDGIVLVCFFGENIGLYYGIVGYLEYLDVFRYLIIFIIFVNYCINERFDY